MGIDRKKRILIIEDEAEMADLVKVVLEREGYCVDIARDGLNGLNKIKSTKPDLVLLDIMLPELDGRDVLKMSKNGEDTKGIPIIILSARTERWDRETSFDLGADEYIEKPIEMVKLLRQVRNVFKKDKSVNHP